MPSWRTTCESRQVACKSLSPPVAGPSVLTSVPIPANAGPLSALQSAQNCYCFPVCVCCLPPLLTHLRSSAEFAAEPRSKESSRTRISRRPRFSQRPKAKAGGVLSSPVSGLSTARPTVVSFRAGPAAIPCRGI